MNTHEIRLWLMNDEGLYNLARRVGSYSELCAELRELGIDTIGGIHIYSGDIDHGELDAEWSDMFGDA